MDRIKTRKQIEEFIKSNRIDEVFNVLFSCLQNEKERLKEVILVP